MKELLLVLVFIAASVLGYWIIRKVPSLLHTPLMSGMNALSGVTVLGALIAGATAYGRQGEPGMTAMLVIALIAISLAMVNVAGGFAVTHKMLRMFRKKSSEEDVK